MFQLKVSVSLCAGARGRPGATAARAVQGRAGQGRVKLTSFAVHVHRTREFSRLVESSCLTCVSLPRAAPRRLAHLSTAVCRVCTSACGMALVCACAYLQRGKYENDIYNTNARQIKMRGCGGRWLKLQYTYSWLPQYQCQYQCRCQLSCH